MSPAAAIAAARMAALALLAIGILVLGWALFIRPGNLKRDVARADAGRTVAEGQAAAAKDSIRITEKTHDSITRIETIQRDGVAAVLAAGSDADAGAAARAAACRLHDSYRGQPACDGVLDAGAAKPAQVDAGLADPGN